MPSLNQSDPRPIDSLANKEDWSERSARELVELATKRGILLTPLDRGRVKIDCPREQESLGREIHKRAEEVHRLLCSPNGDEDKSAIRPVVRGRHVFLSDEVMLRARIAAATSGRSISAVIEDVLHRTLPRYLVQEEQG